MKKVFIIIICIFILNLFSGCSLSKEVTSVEQETIEVKVISTIHTQKKMIPITIDESLTWVSIDEVYSVTFEFEGREYTIDGKSAYEKCNGKDNEYVECTLEKRYYDNSTYDYDYVIVFE